MLRQPAVAGTFYDSDPTRLRNMVQGFLEEEPRKKSLGVIVPHAGYIYSGAVAGKVYSRIELPETFLILSPNHTGLGLPGSVMCRGEWKTPLGEMKVDEALAESLLMGSKTLQEDIQAHLREHSIEVQLPFLQVLGKETFVPVTLQGLDYGTCVEIGEAVASAVQNFEKTVLIVASSDMTHFESRESAKTKDQLALEHVEALDPEGLYHTVHRKRITMCGMIPSTIMLVAAKKLGAKRATVVDYATSGDVTGDFDQVVGYAGVIVE